MKTVPLSSAPHRLHLRHAIVTGGGQGLGQAIARELLRCGCAVALHYHRSAEGAEEVRQEAVAQGLRCATFQADLTVETEAASMVEQATKWLGALDILINNAGALIARKTLLELDATFWRHTQDVNLGSLVYVIRAAVPHLSIRGGASIVNLASLAGRKGGHAGSLAYATAKGAVITLTRALSTELAPHGIRVNAVAPGLILGTRFHAEHTTPESARKTIQEIPLRRAGMPEDVARGVAFLAGEYDGFITGVTLDINGGVYCC
ncbi:MAG TPA: SDR family NAD(P)-dependent oxidoreductase [Opitutaceae bacterium]|nr:SDR family NAD(P)-dependent oxidoreductase [Opitutaceae bacterium]